MTASLEQEIQSLREIQGSEHDPEGRAFVHLADACRRNGDLDEALELLEEGLARHPEFSSAHVVLGWAHRDRGEKHEAGSAFRRVLELDEENTAALRGLGELAEERGSLNAALGWFNRLVALVPEDAEVAERIRTLEEQLGVDAGGELESAAAFSDLDQIMVGEGATGQEHDDFVRMDSVGDEAELGEILAMGEAPDEAPDEAEGAAEPEAEVGVAEEAEEAEAEFGGIEEVEEAEAGLGRTEETAEVGAEFEVAEEAEDEGEDEAWEPEEGGAGEVRTETMGELYARQGLFEKAVEVFEHLVEERPDDERLRARLAELREKAAEGAPAVGAAAAAEGSVEMLAREMSSGEGAAGDLDTPFAWEEDPREAGFAGGEEEAGEPISAYLGRLLTWEPEDVTGAVPIESLAPDAASATPATPATPAMPPATPPVSEAVPIESLAPDAGPAAGAVPIESLAPDAGPAARAVPIESLAPDSGPAAEAVPIESLAPDASPAGDDDFDHWLDRLK